VYPGISMIPNGVMEWWSIGAFSTPTLHYSNTPLLQRSGSLIFHRGQDVWGLQQNLFRARKLELTAASLSVFESVSARLASRV